MKVGDKVYLVVDRGGVWEIYPEPFEIIEMGKNKYNLKDNYGTAFVNFPSNQTFRTLQEALDYAHSGGKNNVDKNLERYGL